MRRSNSQTSAMFDVGGEQRTDGVLCRRFQPFVGIEQHHPGLRRERDHGVLLRGEAEPVLVLDARAEAAGDGDGVVAGTGIEHDHFAANRQQRADATRDAVAFVLGDDDAGQGQGCRHVR